MMGNHLRNLGTISNLRPVYNINLSIKVWYLSVVHMLNYAWKWMVTWASVREDYMHIGAFHHAQVISSIPSVLIGCEPRSGYARVHIYWPTHWHLLVNRCQPGRRANKYYFLLCIRAVAFSSPRPVCRSDCMRAVSFFEAWSVIW